MKVLVMGAAGNAGQAVTPLLANDGFTLRLADVAPPPGGVTGTAEFVRCDTRTPDDVRRAVADMDAVIHLAAWHSAHQPPVSDATIFAVNVDGTFNVIEACREAGVQALVFASSMAYGWGGTYSVTKVIGEDLCRAFHEITGAAVVMLRYHAFVPGPYLEYGARLLRNGVDRQDVATATLAALRAVVERRVDLFCMIVHTNHGMPANVVEHFRELGPEWCESQVPGARRLLEKYNLPLPEKVEQHDLTEAERVLGWRPAVGFLHFLRDLQARDARGDDVTALWVSGELPA
ncbi:MAG TPA: NAD(P)-dependent oxidoreductase [Herpetosiphonaceae bacterium]|nr:NAD(P)-dependent oxidoreductase [Herpetosiphonaceae bacterium]